MEFLQFSYCYERSIQGVSSWKMQPLKQKCAWNFNQQCSSAVEIGQYLFFFFFFLQLGSYHDSDVGSGDRVAVISLPPSENSKRVTTGTSTAVIVGPKRERSRDKSSRSVAHLLHRRRRQTRAVLKRNPHLALCLRPCCRTLLLHYLLKLWR